MYRLSTRDYLEMEDLLFVLLLISFCLLILGLFKPKESLFWTKSNQTRGKSSLIYGLTTILLFIAFGEMTLGKKSVNSYYVENRLSFYDPSDRNFSISDWIRKPDNIRTLHETFKKYGYNKIFSDDDLTSNPCMIWSYINKPCSTLIDSLILTYSHADMSPKYYKEFWDRRKSEQNDSIVYSVLKEVKEELIDKKRMTFNNQLTNDTIYNLLKIKYKRPENEKEAKDNLDYLIKIGLNLSAYNMLYEWTMYENVNWDKDELAKRLKTDTLDCCIAPFIEDDTK